ncbi:MAG: 2-amino-4-hydroxy-6-hydroxymethyldihydropteridine diphosphokinase [Phycisphaerae bacterium]|nr:2-amino-4-hydroxy-6-hydroxymethyldihydropteridine diphosphokinase [Phycisphaerae bacterium]
MTGGEVHSDCFIALGSNLGDRQAHLRAAVESLSRLSGVEVARVSTIIETEPVGPAGQDRYLNGVARVRTTLSPRELLEHLLSIELQRGRDRASSPRWGSRTLDLDLLVYGDRVIDEPGLTVPHPRLRERLFVLEPLAEIAPKLALPPDGRRVRDVLEALRTGTGSAAVRRTDG